MLLEDTLASLTDLLDLLETELERESSELYSLTSTSSLIIIPTAYDDFFIGCICFVSDPMEMAPELDFIVIARFAENFFFFAIPERVF